MSRANAVMKESRTFELLMSFMPGQKMISQFLVLKEENDLIKKNLRDQYEKEFTDLTLLIQ